MSDATLYKWKSKYGGMTVSELRRLKDLEAGNDEPFRAVTSGAQTGGASAGNSELQWRLLKRLLADAMLDNAGLKGLLAKNS